LHTELLLSLDSTYFPFVAILSRGLKIEGAQQKCRPFCVSSQARHEQAFFDFYGYRSGHR
jgi:hypothetical protein